MKWKWTILLPWSFISISLYNDLDSQYNTKWRSYCVKRSHNPKGKNKIEGRATHISTNAKVG
jgi:hypothetical protein